MADVFGDLETLNKRFKLGKHTYDDKAGLHLSHPLFSEGKSHLSNFLIHEVECDEHGRELLSGFFNNHINKRFAEGRTVKFHSSEIHKQLPGVIQALQSSNTTKEKFGESYETIGIRCQLGGHKIWSDSASACANAQSTTADGLLAVGSAELMKSQRANEPNFSHQNIYIFNTNPYAEGFLNLLIRSEFFDRINVIVILNQAQSVTIDLNAYPNIQVIRRRNVDEAVRLIVGSDKSSNDSARLENEENLKISIGDSVLVFTDYEDENNSNVEIVQFIESLDYVLSRAELSGLGAKTDNILTAVEANNEETRFLFEHLSVDKFIDTSGLRVSYLRQGSEFYHGMVNRMKTVSISGGFSLTRWGQYHRTMFNFRRSFDFAEVFKAVRAEIADRFEIMDERGVKQKASGLKYGELKKYVKFNSQPPTQVFTLSRLTACRLAETSKNEYGIGPQLMQMEIDDDYVVNDNDIIIMFPLI